MPPSDAAVRARIRQIASKPRGQQRLHRWLAQVDPKSAAAIAPADREKLLVAAAGLQKRLQEDVPKQDAVAITEMQRRGMTVAKANGPEWRKETDSLGFDDLLTMAKLFDQAHTWIMHQQAADAKARRESQQALGEGDHAVFRDGEMGERNDDVRARLA